MMALSDIPAPTVDWLPQLAAWNATGTDYPHQRCIHELIEDQVARTPQRVALRFEDQSLTYAELNARANRVAHYLRAQGVRPDTCVGLCAERSPALVIGLLGILKAGAAYVPLDVGYPEQRLLYMIENGGFGLLLTHVSVLERAAALGRASPALRLLALDAPDTLALLDGYPDSDPARQPGQSPDNLAYVIYTSGSTGLPKGVMIEHRSLVNRIDWIQKQYPLDGADVFLQKTPFSFDVSVSELVWPFTAGACLVLARPDGHRDVGYLAAVIRREGVTALHFVPSMLALMLGEGEWSACSSVRQVFCSGEALSADLVRRHQALHAAPICNLYGPTEAAIEVSHWACPPSPARVAIGTPIQNVQLHILDPEGRQLPPGEAGELHIGGVCVARGYLNRPDLTAERFIPDPYSERPGARLYRTGDLACRRADGVIDYLGRIDGQVKLNGLRIELGEIESLLRQHPAVTDAAAAVREDVPGQPRLVAYVVLAREAARRAALPPLAELRRHLQDFLPAYMMPAQFALLDSLPLSPAGKVDRKALPAPPRPRRAR
ncbi:non-ribosomal peptide synthetase [Oxalobacteraceae bacterium A2-2]